LSAPSYFRVERPRSFFGVHQTESWNAGNLHFRCSSDSRCLASLGMLDVEFTKHGSRMTLLCGMAQKKMRRILLVQPRQGDSCARGQRPSASSSWEAWSRRCLCCHSVTGNPVASVLTVALHCPNCPRLARRCPAVMYCSATASKGCWHWGWWFQN